MSATLSKPYDWLKQFPASIFKLDSETRPLFGNGPPFPWDEFSKALAKIFDVKEFTIKPTDMQWREPDKLIAGLGAKTVSYPIQFAQFEGTLHWILSSEQIEKLMACLLTAPVQGFNSLESDFTEGFYSFILSQVLKSINDTTFIPNLGAGMEEKKAPPAEPSFCLDISFVIQGQSFKGRAVLSQELIQSWKNKFADRKLDSIIHHPLASKITAPIHLEIGKTHLSPSQLRKLSLGDYLVLENCSYEPDSDKGRLLMTLNGKPIFRAKLKQGSLKILEFPLYQEDTLMNNNEDKDKEADENENNESEMEDFETDFEESEVENEEVTEEETEAEPSEIEEPKEEETVEEEEEKEEEEEEKEKPAVSKTTLPSITPEQKREKSLQNTITELPLNVVIEIGRIQLSIQKLMELQPGSILEMDLHPENGVDLVVNGKRIGKGELLRIGEVIGVRILDLG